jgi:hypothetical protein
MISTTYRNIIYGLALIGIIIILTIPDVVMELLFELVHFFFELLFICFEWLESILDNVVEHLLHTELHQTQTIVFYLLMGIIAIPLYYLWRMLLRLFFRLKVTLPAAWTHYKTRATLYWQNASLDDKIKVMVISAGAIYLASFIFM